MFVKTTGKGPFSREGWAEGRQAAGGGRRTSQAENWVKKNTKVIRGPPESHMIGALPRCQRTQPGSPQHPSPSHTACKAPGQRFIRCLLPCFYIVIVGYKIGAPFFPPLLPSTWAPPRLPQAFLTPSPVPMGMHRRMYILW